MERNDYLKMLVEEMHSTTMATIGADGHPQTRVIDMMLGQERSVFSDGKRKSSLCTAHGAGLCGNFCDE